MSARFLAAILLVALASAAPADVDLPAQNGDAITGTLDPATELEAFRFVAPAGARLTVKAKALKKGPSLLVRVYDAQNGVVTEGTGKAVALKGVELPASGEYRVEVRSSDLSTAGDYSLAITWKSPTSFGGPMTVPGSGKIDVPFAADQTARLTLSVKAARGSAATPALVHLARPDGTFDILSGTKAEAFASPGGDHVLRVADPGVGGAVVVAVKVKPPRLAKRKLRIDARAVPADGVVFTAGLATPLGGGAGVGAGPLAGTQVSVPAGAVGGPTAILIGEGTAVEAGSLGLNLAGPAILLGPEGLDFRGDKTASVTIPFDPAAFPHGTSGLRVFTRSAGGVVTEVTGLSIDDANHVVSFPAAHFSVFQVFAPSGVTQVAKLDPADLAQSDFHGFALALSGDYAVVGAPFQEGVGGAQDTGAAYVYQRIGGVWTQIQKLTAPAPVAQDFFGIAVAIDADTIAVGATGRDFAASNSGAVFVFVRSGSTFVPQQQIVPSGALVNDAFGGSLSIDVDTLVAGSLGDDGGGTDAGTAYVFVRAAGVWSQQQEIRPADLSAGDQYGKDVAVSGDRIVVGAPAASPAFPKGGAAYVWLRTGTTWSQEQKLVQTKAEANDQFGWSVAIDGTTLVAGARLRRGSALFEGAAFVFVRGANSWAQEQEVVSVDIAGGDQFGESVALEGDLLVCGALFKTLPNLHFGGAAYVFSRTGTVWTQRARLTPSDGAPDDTFGFPVALSQKTVLVGAYQKDRGAAVDTGAAYVFDFVP